MTPSSGATLSLAEMIAAKQGKLKATEIEERVVQEDEVVLALRGILTARRQDTNISSDEEEEDDDDWSE
ncbi:hypothetical protein EHI8A_075580 [Entamoeba histolytica HM-1:IMSS-B]|nr:hypothetical protein EHI8A_075580 [Entamoeba histolytica HM-1:IMSS-B]